MARRATSWLDYWTASDRPAKPGRGRSRGRTPARGRSRSGGPGSLSWWLGNVGSKPAPAYGRITAPPRERVRGGKGTCPLCGKAAGCKCRMVKGDPIKRPRRRPGSAPYAYPPDFRAQGAVWCGACRHRINTYTGHCTNSKCSR